MIRSKRYIFIIISGIPFVYEFDEKMNPVVSMKFLVDNERVRSAMELIANQGKIKKEEVSPISRTFIPPKPAQLKAPLLSVDQAKNAHYSRGGLGFILPTLQLKQNIHCQVQRMNPHLSCQH